jgi:hypothetical protein
MLGELIVTYALGCSIDSYALAHPEGYATYLKQANFLFVVVYLVLIK